MNSVPSCFKAAVPYLTHARQLRGVDDLMAYYCALHALDVAMHQSAPDAAARRYLGDLLGETEALKAGLAETIAHQAEQGSAQDYVLVFAMRVFVAAAAADRAGRADKRTAQNFYAAANFLEVATQFGPLPPQAHQRLVYAKRKAADIMKALKAGVKPQPGLPSAAPAATAPAPESASAESAPSESAPSESAPEPENNIIAFPAIPTSSSHSQPSPSPDMQPQPQKPRALPKPPQPKAPQQPPAQPPKPTQQPATKPAQQPATQPAQPALGGSIIDFSDAQKSCRSAAAALNFEDVPTAVAHLITALEQITGQHYVEAP